MTATLKRFLENGYVDLELVGEGSEGRVWRARRLEDSMPVAVKEYRTGAGRNFYQELRVLSSFAHPNALQLLDFFDNGSTRAIVWEYCSGGTLRARFDEPHDFRVAFVIDLVRQIVSALAALHSQGVIHGDVKPENILRARKTGIPVWKLGDFGLSSQQTSGRVLTWGTQAYLAPEVPRGNRSPLSDVYSLGCVLHESLERLRTITDAAEAATSQRLLALAAAMTAHQRDARPSSQEVLSEMNELAGHWMAERYLRSESDDANQLGILESWKSEKADA